MQKIFIITGTSRGLGFYLAQKALEENHVVIGIARHNKLKHPNFRFLRLDLSTSGRLDQKLNLFFRREKITVKSRQLILVNNAATILPINYLHKVKEPDSLSEAVGLNLQAPILLSHFVLKNFLKDAAQITICNVSSGAAYQPLVNWSLYCALKSGLKMFTECLRLDYKDNKNFKCFSFFPGVMDTEMQAVIRGQPSRSFENVQYFKSLKSNKDLIDPKAVADALFGILSRPKRITRGEYNINE
jgi:benzil reductase ((S)-benzoin forming)